MSNKLRESGHFIFFVTYKPRQTPINQSVKAERYAKDKHSRLIRPINKLEKNLNAVRQALGEEKRKEKS